MRNEREAQASKPLSGVNNDASLGRLPRGQEISPGEHVDCITCAGLKEHP